MRELVYYVATSIDGFIAHTDGSVDGFLMEGPHADDYLDSLRDEFGAVVMGRRTYEWGYDHGAVPGEPAYEAFALANYIVSRSLPFESRPGFEVIRDAPAARIAEIKAEPGAPIYLCGGSEVAGLLLHAGLVDRVVLKVNRFVMGTGVPLFGGGRRVLAMDDSEGSHLSQRSPAGHLPAGERNRNDLHVAFHRPGERGVPRPATSPH